MRSRGLPVATARHSGHSRAMTAVSGTEAAQQRLSTNALPDSVERAVRRRGGSTMNAHVLAERTGSGWRTFAGILIMLVGIFNVIDGIVTIANPHYFAIYSDGYTHHLIFGDLTRGAGPSSYWGSCSSWLRSPSSP